MRKFLKRMGYVFVIIIVLVALGSCAILNMSDFGKLPAGERLARIEQSPNYRDGHFQNLSETPDLTPTGSKWSFFYN